MDELADGSVPLQCHAIGCESIVWFLLGHEWVMDMFDNMHPIEEMFALLSVVSTVQLQPRKRKWNQSLLQAKRFMVMMVME